MKPSTADVANGAVLASRRYLTAAIDQQHQLPAPTSEFRPLVRTLRRQTLHLHLRSINTVEISTRGCPCPLLCARRRRRRCTGNFIRC
jgi:hypothetical protein